ncbi:MAG: 50S ribosomal protein L35ae [Nanoarchaeota archaeon]
MEAKIISFRRGRHTQYDNQMLLRVDGVSSREDAEKLVGKAVEWIAPGKKKTTINGKVAAAHGNKGVARVIFEKGMPGQSVSTSVSLK